MNARVRRHTTFFAMLMLLAAAHTGADPGPRGAELLAPFKKQLKQALLESLQEGPVNAVSACRIEAPQIAATLSVDGVTMGRASHRLRNPLNVAPEWVDEILQDYVADSSDREPRKLQLQDDMEGYVEPIVMAPLCLACHGDNLAPDVQAKIDELYPHDEATGFGADQLRGVFWVAYPRAAAD